LIEIKDLIQAVKAIHHEFFETNAQV
jgi:hypothetical protein